MSQQQKTRTKSTEALLPRHDRKLKQIRLEVAAEAARIIATEGQHNFHAAKKKAAARIGVNQRLALPSNMEVQEALQHYQRLYGGLEHADNLEHLRLVAVGVMNSLHDYCPRLVGSVLDGTAGKHSRIALHVFCDAPEELVLDLLEWGKPFNQEQRQIRWHDGSHRTVPILVVEEGGAAVELAIFTRIDLRQPPPSPLDGKPQHRANLYEVECLLAPE